MLGAIFLIVIVAFSAVFFGILHNSIPPQHFYLSHSSQIWPLFVWMCIIYTWPRTEAVQPSKAMELFLGGKHWLDAISPPLETHFEKLASQLKFLADRENAPPAADAAAALEFRV